jgi:hypothetical protein
MTADELRAAIETAGGYPVYVEARDKVLYLVQDRSCLAWPSTHVGMVVVFTSGRQIVVLPLDEVAAIHAVDPPLRPGERRVTRKELEAVAAKGPYRVRLANGNVFVMPAGLERVFLPPSKEGFVMFNPTGGGMHQTRASQIQSLTPVSPDAAPP